MITRLANADSSFRVPVCPDPHDHQHLKCLQFSRVNNGHLALGCARVGAKRLDGLDKTLPFQYLAENDVATIKPRCLNRERRDEETFQ